MARAAKAKRVPTADGAYVVRGKTANGEGSLYQEANGSWRATYRLPGESRARRVRGRTRDEALRRRQEAIATGSPSGGSSRRRLHPSSTVDDFSAWWLDTIARHRVRPSSLAKYEDRVVRISRSLGTLRLTQLTPERVAAWQADLLDSLAPKTVADTRATLRSLMAEAVNLNLVAANPVDRVKPPTVRRRSRRALSSTEARALIEVAMDDRLGAAVALFFVQGWRVSEVLGLSWSDLDLDRATAVVSRASVYADGHGMMLGPPKTSGAAGVYALAPVVVGLLKQRRQTQLEDRRAAGPQWVDQQYEGRPIDLVFTTATGQLLVRQAVSKAVLRSARAVGIDTVGLGTHTGRSTAITALYTEEGIDIDDIARHVGHASATTTAGYVRHLGTRPRRTADAAIRLLDPTVPQEGSD